MNKIISVFKKAKNIAILPHVSVDGDGLGSSLALGLALKEMDKHVTIYLEEDTPAIYDFLPGRQLIKVYDRNDAEFDVVVALDTGDVERLGERAAILNSAKTTMNIDHHQTNTEFACYNFVQAYSSATGEIIYQLIKRMGTDLNPDISNCLYVAIATDTGGFRYSNTTSLTHQIVSDLINNGVDISQVSKRIFETTSLQKVKLIGIAIDTLEVVENGKLAVITITDEALKKSGAREEECDGIVNIGRNIGGVEVAVVFRQKDDNEVKVNLRSNEYIDVSAIAIAHNGGGHKKAAGCTIKGKLDEAKRIILDDVKKVLQ